MTTIKSEKTPINASAEKVYLKLSDLESLKPLLERVPADQIPEERRELFDNMKITSDSIRIPGGPMGEICLMVTNLTPYSFIQLTGEGSPIPLSLQLEIEDCGSNECMVQVGVSIDVPIMLKPMISGPLRKVVEQFAQVIKAIPFD